MTELRVWAPNAELVELQFEPAGTRREMKKGHDGWHRIDDALIRSRARYRFVIEGGEPVPDPRSAYQPEGVHGPSEIVDHSSFKWSDTVWHGVHLPSAVIYEMHIGTFTPEGTFASAITQLDHLCELGVTAIEVMPIAEFPGDRGWGYDGVQLFAPHHSYGGPDGFKLFVDACHRKGLGVILDVVYNHLGPDGNYLGHHGPYFTDRYNTPWGQAVNMDGPHSDEVRRFFVDNALTWMRDYHVDGLRLDAVHTIIDNSATHILEELAREVHALGARLGKSLFLIAESDLNDPRLVRSAEANGYGLDAQWSDEFHHALHSALTGERDGYYVDFGSLEAVAKALNDVFVCDGEFSAFRQRRYGRPVGDLPRWKFVGYLQNHDQIGNRAAGERTSALMNHGRLKVGAALVLLSPFVPMLFQGEEWGASTPFQYFTDHIDEDLGAAVSHGRRNEFQAFGWNPDEVPDPQAERTFLDSKLNWKELEHPSHTEILQWHHDLIALRKREPALCDDGLSLNASVDGTMLTVERGNIRVVANIGEIGALKTGNDGWKVVLASEPDMGLYGGELVLPPDSVAVLRLG